MCRTIFEEASGLEPVKQFETEFAIVFVAEAK